LNSIEVQLDAGAYTNEIQFQRAIVQATGALRDGHTIYQPQTCFLAWTFLIPLGLYSYVDGGNQVLEVTASPHDAKYSIGALAGPYKTTTGVDVTTYHGKRVDTIDGVAWKTAITSFADTLHISRDAGTRFNSAVQGGILSSFMTRVWGEVPTSGSMTIAFTDGTTGTLPWVSYVNSESVSAASASSLQTNCYTARSSRRDAGHGARFRRDPYSVSPPDPLGPIANLPGGGTASIDPLSRRNTATPTPAPASAAPTVQGVVLTSNCGQAGSTTYKGCFDLTLLAVEKLAVLKVESFIPSSCFGACTQYTVMANGVTANLQGPPYNFMSDSKNMINKMQEWLTAGSATKVLLDMRGNTGGYVVAMQHFGYALTGNWDIFNKSFLGTYRHSPASTALTSGCVGALKGTYSPTQQLLGCLEVIGLGQSTGPTSPLYWSKSDGTKYGSDDKDWWCPASHNDTYCQGTGAIQGGTCASFSKPASSNPSGAFQALFASYPALAVSGTTIAPSSNILFTLSNGICGSACSMLLRFFDVGNYARQVVVGGLKNEAQQYGSFGGGEAWPSIYSYQIATWLSLIAPGVMPSTYPGVFPFGGQDLSLVPRMWLKTNSNYDISNMPMEFYFKPAEIRLDFSSTTVRDETLLYKATNTRIAACAGDTCNQCATSAQTCTAPGSLSTCSAAPEAFGTTISGAVPSHSGPCLSVLWLLASSAIFLSCV